MKENEIGYLISTTQFVSMWAMYLLLIGILLIASLLTAYGVWEFVKKKTNQMKGRV